MAKNPERTRTSILDAADRLLRRGGGGTVDEVAREARCAKGLVHYHFKTKAGLLAAVATRLGERRRTRWAEAFRAPTPDAAIKRSWSLLVAEARDGTVRAWTALLAQREKATDQAVSVESATFSAAISDSADGLLKELGLVPTVPSEELGLLLAGVVHGMGLQLESGTEPERLQGAYAAAWLGVLSLTRQASG
ncbi:MAG TPA: helix-turn-helix domain-containing protein [Gemmatimonadales bacterium]|nr:helix-turn-helix domain-containing protein [Gemmatimonadales bacterium]